MNKPMLLLFVVLGIGAGAAVMMSRGDLEHERARADALAERLAVLEPVERASNSQLNDAQARPVKAPPLQSELAVERPSEQPTSIDVPEQSSKAKVQFRGSPQARQQVERLQAALVGHTPLQDYQTQALITAIDRVQAEIENEKKNASSESVIDWQSETRDRLLQSAADILFESQFEKFIGLLKSENAAPPL
jgi:hypothetical protein